MNARRLALLVLGFGVLVGQAGAAQAVQPDSWQLRRLFQPTQAERASEAKGRVMVYDGLTDRTILKAMDEQFQRLDAMMFTRVVLTDERGATRRDPDSGAVLYEDDGCD